MVYKAGRFGRQTKAQAKRMHLRHCETIDRIAKYGVGGYPPKTKPKPKVKQLRLNSLGDIVRRGLERRIGRELEKKERPIRGIFVPPQEIIAYPDMEIEGFEEDEITNLYLRGKLKKLWR